MENYGNTAMELIEEGRRLVCECRELLSEVNIILQEQKNESEIMRYKRMLADMQNDNLRLFRENTLLKSKLQ